MIRISPEEARAWLLGQLQLQGFGYRSRKQDLTRLLQDLRCIQIDPLSPLLSNPDLVALARVEDYKQHELFQHLLPGEAFEHFAKERCLLPASAFPWYRDRISETPWWRMRDRLKRLPPEVIEAVWAEVDQYGPLLPANLTDHGAVKPMDYSGWKSTAKMAVMALEVLWVQCRVVVSGRDGRNKIYDVPRRALSHVAEAESGDFGRWAIKERTEAAGLLPRNSGPHWSMLENFRREGLPDQMVKEGLIEEVMIEGANTRYFAPKGFRERVFPEGDDHMRIIGPLDPIIWYRPLVHHVFGFEYLWEVYKPVDQRRWGWYVCPLLHQGRFVGRLEGKVDGDSLEIHTIWKEPDCRLDPKALDRALRRLARARGVKNIKRPKVPRSHKNPSRL